MCVFVFAADVCSPLTNVSFVYVIVSVRCVCMPLWAQCFLFAELNVANPLRITVLNFPKLYCTLVTAQYCTGAAFVRYNVFVHSKFWRIIEAKLICNKHSHIQKLNDLITFQMFVFSITFRNLYEKCNWFSKGIAER